MRSDSGTVGAFAAILAQCSVKGSGSWEQIGEQYLAVPVANADFFHGEFVEDPALTAGLLLKCDISLLDFRILVDPNQAGNDIRS